VNPGSDTYPLDVSAAWTEDRKTLTVAILNPSDAEHTMSLGISHATVTGPAKLWQMAPKSVDAVVAVGKTPGVTVDESTLPALPDTIVAPPFSVSIYSFPAK
jgi:alpha-N-arabinofuranosidase